MTSQDMCDFINNAADALKLAIRDAEDFGVDNDDLDEAGVYDRIGDAIGGSAFFMDMIRSAVDHIVSDSPEDFALDIAHVEDAIAARKFPGVNCTPIQPA